VKLLLARGANARTTDAGGTTPLHDAAYSGDLDCLGALLGAKALIGARDADGRTALHIASCGDNPKAVSFLLRKGADVLEADHTGMTPLHVAVEYGSEENVHILLQAGADVNAKEAGGATPLDLCDEKDVFAELKQAKAIYGSGRKAPQTLHQTPRRAVGAAASSLSALWV
jgi:ankyrin repeat protein